MGYTIKDRDTGRTTYAKDVRTEGEFIKTDRGHIYHGRNVDVEKCFVATASGADPETLAVLRLYRDTVLRRSFLGRLFIDVYYRLGPWCAGMITRHSWLCKIAKRAIVGPAATVARANFKRKAN